MNVLIVDDDRFVVASLSSGLNWEALGFTHIYTAYNIADAKTILAQKDVHLLLSDIDMPYGSGLDLLTWIRGAHRDLPVIFLTNYADFGYAQKALALKSFHYFLKPIEYDKLTCIIKDAILEINRQNTQSNKIREHFWLSFLQEEIDDVPSELSYTSDSIFLSVIFDLFPLYLSAEDTLKSHFAENSVQIPYMKATFASVFADSFHANDIFLEYNAASSRYLAVFELADETLPPTLVMDCERFLETIYEQTHCMSNCFVGIPCRFSNFRRNFFRLRTMMMNSLDCKQEVLLLSRYEESETQYPAFDTGILELYLTNGEYPAFFDFCHRYLLSLSSEKKLDACSINSFQVDVVQILHVFLKSRGILAHKLFHGADYHKLAANARSSRYAMELYLRYMLRIVKDYLIFTDSSKSVAKSIMDYVDSHYAEDISRSSLTDILYLDPDYASRLFKKETGISFGSYLINKRIEVAKNLLVTTSLPINTIADNVGYGNYSYFIRLFKKMTQMTPIEFRNQKI